MYGRILRNRVYIISLLGPLATDGRCTLFNFLFDFIGTMKVLQNLQVIVPAENEVEQSLQLHAGPKGYVLIQIVKPIPDKPSSND